MEINGDKLTMEKGVIIKPSEMSPKLLEAYENGLRRFSYEKMRGKPRAGVLYNGSQTLHYFTILDKGCNTTFPIEEEDIVRDKVMLESFYSSDTTALGRTKAEEIDVTNMTVEEVEKVAKEQRSLGRDIEIRRIFL